MGPLRDLLHDGADLVNFPPDGRTPFDPEHGALALPPVEFLPHESLPDTSGVRELFTGLGYTASD